MSYSPRLGVFAALLALVMSAVSPAHARHRLNTANPNPNPEAQGQNPDAAPQQPSGVQGSYPGAAANPQYGGYVPAMTPPNGVSQPPPPPNPQYLPNPYVNTGPNGYGARNQPPNQVPNQIKAGANGATVPPSNAAPALQSSSVGIADQYPPKPPRVSFRNGQLSISAENSTLPDILTAIHQRTGAAMELPAAIGNERVAVKLGPATTGEVMAALLNGSHFDYIVLNRPEDPSSPERIILREKVAPDANPNNNNGYNNGYGNGANGQQPAYQPPAEIVQEMPETVPDEEVPEQEVPQPPTGDQNQGNAKTPEQLLEELRQMQQQRGQPPPQLQQPQPPLVDDGQPPL